MIPNQGQAFNRALPISLRHKASDTHDPLTCGLSDNWPDSCPICAATWPQLTSRHAAEQFKREQSELQDRAVAADTLAAIARVVRHYPSELKAILSSVKGGA